jgi:hypothetical protein
METGVLFHPAALGAGVKAPQASEGARVSIFTDGDVEVTEYPALSVTVTVLGDTNTRTYLINQVNGAKLPMITPPEDGAVPQGASTRTARRMMKQAGQFPPAASRLIAGRTYSLQIPNWGLTLS